MKKNFEIKDNTAIIKINENIYSKEVLIQTAYVKLEKYYFLIDKKDNYFIISMKFKDPSKKINEKAIYAFLDELIESQSYLEQIKRTSKIREIILEKALIGQTLDDKTIENLEKDLEN